MSADMLCVERRRAQTVLSVLSSPKDTWDSCWGCKRSISAQEAESNSQDELNASHKLRLSGSSRYILISLIKSCYP